MEANQASFDWGSFIGDHPLFGDLAQRDIDILLDPGNSKQQDYKRGEVVFRAGEISNSFFLIGEGSVDVELASDESSATIISTFYRGDYFGEMSAIDSEGGRAATILAHEDCILLEIKSKPFQQVIKANPELEFKLLSMLTTRLRHVNDQILKNTRLTYDNKFSLLSEKIESQSKVVDAALNASQAVFEQTKVRTSEVIESAERGRARLTWMLSILTTGFALVFTVIGFFGYNEFKAAESNADKTDDIYKKVQTKEQEINEVSVRAEQAVAQAESAAQSIRDAKDNVAELQDIIARVNVTLDELQTSIDLSKETQLIVAESLISIFSHQVVEKINAAEHAVPGTVGLQLLELNDASVTLKLFTRIFSMISESHENILANGGSELDRNKISFLTSFMYLYIYNVDGRTDDNKLAQFLSSYLLLITYAMDEAYAGDNDFYHDAIDPQQYPKDGFSRRLQELKYGAVFDLEKVKMLAEKHNLVDELESVLEPINRPDNSFKIEERKKISINEVLGYIYRPKS